MEVLSGCACPVYVDYSILKSVWGSCTANNRFGEMTSAVDSPMDSAGKVLSTRYVTQKNKHLSYDVIKEFQMVHTAVIEFEQAVRISKSHMPKLTLYGQCIRTGKEQLILMGFLEKEMEKWEKTVKRAIRTLDNLESRLNDAGCLDNADVKKFLSDWSLGIDIECIGSIFCHDEKKTLHDALEEFRGRHVEHYAPKEKSSAAWPEWLLFFMDPFSSCRVPL